MNDIPLYTKISGLSSDLKAEVSDFIYFLKLKSDTKSHHQKKRVPGKAKGLIKMKSNFDLPIEGFSDYMKWIY